VAQLAGEGRGQRRVALVEPFHGGADRVAIEQLFQRREEDLDLWLIAVVEKGPGPGALDMPDDGDSPAGGVGEEPARQRGDERVRGDGLTAVEPALVWEIFQVWRAGAETGEVDGDRAQQPGAGRYVV